MDIAQAAATATVAPCIGIKSDEFFIITEKQVLCESENFATALVDMIAAYFTFNMSYPDSLYPLLLFIQHYILDIKDSQTVVNIVYSALTRC